MKEMNFLELLASKEYNFLREDERLGKNIILLTLGGSHAYGTNIESSDIDIRGCTLNSKADILSLGQYEQFTDIATDTTIYSFRKLISLLTNCNPNTIELLGCRQEHYLYLHSVGQELLDNKKLFLSQMAYTSFAGYANQQLRRLENALARDAYPQAEKEKHILGSCISAMRDFNRKYSDFDKGSLFLHIEKSENPELETEIQIDVDLKQYPLRDYKNMLLDLNTIVKDYGKLNKRNKKKDDASLNKHAMHLIRLFLMCNDILEKEDIITYRQNEIGLLMDIRNGKFQKEDSTYREEFFEMLNEYEKKLQYAKNNTSLQPNPDYKRINEFMMDVNEKVVRGDY